MSKRKIGLASLTILCSALCINVLQLLKLILVSMWFGASSGLLDSYFQALILPLTLQGLVVGTLQACFIPVYVNHVTKGEAVEANQLLSSTFGFALAIFGTMVPVLWYFAPHTMTVVSGELSSAAVTEITYMYRLTLLSLLAGGLADVIANFYFAHQRYFYPSLAPVAAILITTVYLVLFKEQGAYALIYGQVLASAVQLLMLACGSVRWGNFRLRTSLGFVASQFKPIYSMMLPIGSSLLLANANNVIDIAVASRLPEGNTTVLAQASRIHDIILKLFVVSISTSLLPFFSQYVAEKRFTEFRSVLTTGTRVAFLVLAPATIAIFFFAVEWIAVVLQREEFTPRDSSLVGYTWAAYAVGCFFVAATHYYGRALNALLALRPMVIAASVGIPLNLVLDILFARWFGVVGIAMATPVVYCFYMLYYQFQFKKQLHGLAAEHSQADLWRYLPPLAIFTAVCYVTDRYLVSIVPLEALDDFAKRMTLLSLLILSAAISSCTYLGALSVFQVKEFESILALLRKVSPLNRLKPS